MRRIILRDRRYTYGYSDEKGAFRYLRFGVDKGRAVVRVSNRKRIEAVRGYFRIYAIPDFKAVGNGEMFDGAKHGIQRQTTEILRDYVVGPCANRNVQSGMERDGHDLSIYRKGERNEMKKVEFLVRLKENLSCLPEADIRQSLEYYAEMIDDRMDDGMTEEIAVQSVGDPKRIAEDIIIETPITKLFKERVKSKGKLGAWGIVLLVLGSPIWLSLIIAFLAVVLSLYVSYCAVVLSLLATELALIVTAPAGVIYAIICAVTGNGYFALAMLGGSVFVAGLALLGLPACKFLIKSVVWVGKKSIVLLKSCITK